MINNTNEILLLGQLPLWYITNIHIKEGYRKPNTLIIFLESLLSIHNETFNIWINLIGIIEFIILVIIQSKGRAKFL